MTTLARTSVVRFSGPLSRQVGGGGNGDIIQQLNSYFLSNPNVLLRDATVYARGFDEKSYGLSVTLMVQLPGVVTGQPATPAGYAYTASYIAAGGTSVEAQTNIILASGAIYGKIIPLSSLRPGRQVSNDWIFIRANASGLQTSGMGNPLEPAFGAPNATLAVGATGAATLWTARGLPLGGTYNVRNIGANSWAAGDRNYVYWDWKTGILVGMPACGAAAALTTSTSTGPI